MRRPLLAVFLVMAVSQLAAAQAPPRSQAPEPAIRRWFEFQQFVLSTRYRFIRNSADVVTSDQMQYREQIRARVNLDAKKRYTVNAGLFSGSSFTSSWDNLGPGTGDFDGRDHYLKQLYVDAAPVAGLDFQGGGLYVNRGENTEFTSYDDDGYLIGGRADIRKPALLYVDELSITHGLLGPAGVPSVWSRWNDADDTNYTQVLAAKRFSPMIAGSADYTRYAGSDTLRAAVALRFKAGSPLSGLRYEQYVRTSGSEAAGFSVMAERSIVRGIRVQGGYATIDEHYGGLNADRVQRGRRLIGTASVPIYGPLSASIFVTHAFDADYSISNRTRFDGVLAWDVLDSLHRTGVF